MKSQRVSADQTCRRHPAWRDRADRATWRSSTQAFSRTQSPAVPRQNRARLCSTVNGALVVLARAARDQRGGVRRRATSTSCASRARQPTPAHSMARVSRCSTIAATSDRQHNPIAIAQYGLARFNRWCNTADDADRAAWLAVARWLTTGTEAEHPRRSGLVSSFRLSLPAAAESSLVLRPRAGKRSVPARARGAGHRRPDVRRRVRIAHFSRSSDRSPKGECWSRTTADMSGSRSTWSIRQATS